MGIGGHCHLGLGNRCNSALLSELALEYIRYPRSPQDEQVLLKPDECFEVGRWNKEARTLNIPRS